MALFEWKGQAELAPLQESTFEALGIRERADLQHMLRDNIEMIEPDLMVLAEEYGEFEDSRRRIDLLCLDKQADLVVLELKRTEDGGHMDLQGIRYAAMVSAMTFDNVVEAHERYLAHRGGQSENARTGILEFVGWEDPDEEVFAKNVRILLVSGDFSKELTTSVLWLNERQLDIRCIRLKPYQQGERILLDVQRIIPLPEAEEYQVKLRKKGMEERIRAADKQERRIRFWTQHLQKASEKTTLHSRNRPQIGHYIAANAGKPGLLYSYAHTKNGIRAELYIDVGDGNRNKEIFDELHAKSEEIESAFGGPLHWDRLDNRRASRVSIGPLELSGEYLHGYDENEDRWPEIQNIWIESMIRLDRALRPHIDKITP